MIYNFLHKTEAGDLTDTYNSFDAGGEVNYKLLFGQFVVEPSIRVIYKTSNYAEYNKGIFILPGINIGYA